MWAEMSAHDVDVLPHMHRKRTCLELWHPCMNERRREADSQGLQRKEEGSDASFLPSWPVPRLLPKVTTWGWD